MKLPIVRVMAMALLAAGLHGHALASAADVRSSSGTSGVSSSPATISNVEPRRDSTGAIMNVHDGALYHVGSRYYLLGTSYFECEGFTNCSVSVLRSARDSSECSAL